MSDLETQISQFAPKSVFRLEIEKKTGHIIYYVHEFIVNNKLYGTLHYWKIKSTYSGRKIPIKQKIKNLHDKHEQLFASTYCFPCNYDDKDNLHVYVSEEDMEDQAEEAKSLVRVTGFKVIHKEKGKPEIYINLPFDDIKVMIKNDVELWCDYMDQGLGPMSDIYDAQEALDKKYYYGDEFGYTYYAAEDIVVDKEEYEDALMKEEDL